MFKALEAAILVAIDEAENDLGQLSKLHDLHGFVFWCLPT